MEVMGPQLRRISPGQKVTVHRVAPTELLFDEYDVASQGLVSHHYTIVDDTLRGCSVPFRYVWPSELDLMAAMAGMTLEHTDGPDGATSHLRRTAPATSRSGE